MYANERFPLGRVPGGLRVLFEPARAESAAFNALTIKLGERIKKGAEAPRQQEARHRARQCAMDRRAPGRDGDGACAARRGVVTRDAMGEVQRRCRDFRHAGRFDRFFEQAGFGPRYDTCALRLDSPFDYLNRANS